NSSTVRQANPPPRPDGGFFVFRESFVRSQHVEVDATRKKIRCLPETAMKRTGAQIFWDVLAEQGVDVVFGYPGGAIMPVYDALVGQSVRHVLVRHEQGAAHMADGYARASGRVGVALATSGPGATNLVTGIATAMLDSSPVVFVTGQVAAPLLGSD